MAVRMTFGYHTGFFGEADGGSAFDNHFVPRMDAGENLCAYAVTLSDSDRYFLVALFVKLYVYEVVALLLG